VKSSSSLEQRSKFLVMRRTVQVNPGRGVHERIPDDRAIGSVVNAALVLTGSTHIARVIDPDIIERMVENVALRIVGG